MVDIIDHPGHPETVFQFSRFVLKDLTVPDEVGAELDAVQVVRLTLIVEPHLLQVLAILPWQGMTISSKKMKIKVEIMKVLRLYY